MEDLIAILRAAAATDATDEARQAGIAASQALLTAFTQPGASQAASDSRSGPTLAVSASPQIVGATSAPAPSPAPPAPSPAPPAPSSPPAFDPGAIAAIVHSLRGLPPEQLLDLAITRLRAALPPSASQPSSRAESPSLRFHIIPLPAGFDGGSGSVAARTPTAASRSPKK